MPTDNFTVIAFLIGTGVVVAGIGIAQTDWRHKWLIRGLIGVGIILVLAGITWPLLHWGLPRLAGIVAEVATHPASWFSIVILLLSGNLLLRWRRSIVPGVTEMEALKSCLDKHIADQIEIKRSLDDAIGRVNDKLKTSTADLQELDNRTSSKHFDINLQIRNIELVSQQLEAKAETINHLMKDIKAQVEQSYELACRGQQRLADALRARDAEAIIKEADAILTSLGRKLKEATPAEYNNPDAWMSDYETWAEAISKIDDIAAKWQPQHWRFLNVRRGDYEKIPDNPPTNIASSSTIIPFKTLCFVQGRYLKERAGIISYFNAKAGDL